MRLWGEIYQDTADDVAQMRNIVDIGQSAGDEYVVLPGLRDCGFS